MEFIMKKAHIILFFLVLSVAWSQKEIPGLGSTLETTGDERLNGEKVQPIDAKIVQQVRMMKANKEKAFMKKQILSGQMLEDKTFKIPISESKYLQVKELIKSIKQDVKPIEISNLEFAPKSNNSLNSNIYKNRNEEK